MKRASTWLGPGALPSALSSADRRSCIKYCWTWAEAPSGTRGSGGREPPGSREGPPGSCGTALARRGEPHVVGLCEDCLGVGDPHVPVARRARSLHLDGRQEFAQVGDVLLEGGYLPLQLLMQLAPCGWAAPPWVRAPPQSGCRAGPRLPGTPAARILPGRRSGGSSPVAVSHSQGGLLPPGPTPSETVASAPPCAPGRHAPRGGDRTPCPQRPRAWTRRRPAKRGRARAPGRARPARR